MFSGKREGCAQSDPKLEQAAASDESIQRVHDDLLHAKREPREGYAWMPLFILGLVSTKWTALEDRQELRRRIEEASAFHPLEHLAIGTQCGFASAAEMAEQRMITEETQVDKLRRVAETARAVWG